MHTGLLATAHASGSPCSHEIILHYMAPSHNDSKPSAHGPRRHAGGWPMIGPAHWATLVFTRSKEPCEFLVLDGAYE